MAGRQGSGSFLNLAGFSSTALSTFWSGGLFVRDRRGNCGLLGSGAKPCGTLSGPAEATGVSTLSAGAGAGTRVVGAGDVLGLVSGRQLVKISERFRRTEVSLSVSGARGDPAEGLFRAWTLSRAPAMTRSRDEAVGIATCCGNHCKVSQVRSRLVSHTQVR
jgi:hypothetical protein